MDYYSSQITKLIEELSKLPGIGNKSAQRLAFHIINMPEEQVERLSSAITSAKKNVRYCRECFTLTDKELCPICESQKRDHSVIMVVENTRDLAAYEKTGKYDGVYHVLHGAISPMLGIGPGDIRLKELMARLQREEVKEAILHAGMWPFIKQRPYDIVASPADEPRDIFVSAFYSAPLAPNFDFVVKGQEVDFQTGLDALAKLTDGKVYVGIRKGSSVSVKGVETVEVEGPHPAANVGVQINHIKPINKGEVVWTVNPADVIVIGRLFNKGIADFSRLVVITGSETTERGYVKAIAGCTIASLVDGKIMRGNEDIRIISGNVLTGTKVEKNDYLGAYDNQITVIPEGDETHDFFGWATPGFGKFSVSHSFPAWLMGKNKEYVIDARIKGGKRAMIMSNEYDSVFPMDIMPEYLLKAIIAFDIDKMENLGIYEVAPEDFALCEFVDTSKLEIQKIVRQGLDVLYKE